MSRVTFLRDRGIQVAVTPEGGLNLKGLSGLNDGTRQEILTFARDNKQSIISELETPSPDLSRIQPEGFMIWQERSRLKIIPGLPDDLFQAPVIYRPGSSTDQEAHRNTCPGYPQCS